MTHGATAGPPDDPALVYRSGERGTHVLVVGITCYTHHGQGAPPPTCSTYSARAVATWFLERFVNPDAPLASLSLLLSEDAPATFPHPKATHAGHIIPSGTATDVSEAIEKWLTRASSDVGNLAIVYLAGHGLSAGSKQLLLLRDYGARSFNPSHGALDVTGFARALKTMTPGRQLILVDACREPDADLDESVLGGGSPGDPVIAPRSLRHRPGFRPALQSLNYAATDLAHAHGRVGGLTLFAEALLKALEGGGAETARSMWVGTHGLEAALSAYIGRLAETEGVWQAPERLASQPFSIHKPSKISVPFHVTFAPASQLTDAGRLSASLGGSEVSERRWHHLESPAEEWSFVSSYREHKISACFDAPARFADGDWYVQPGLPETVFELEFEAWP